MPFNMGADWSQYLSNRFQSLVAPVAPIIAAPIIQAKPQLAAVKAPPPSAPMPTISPIEMAAIDEAIKSGTAISIPPIQGRELFQKQADVIITGEAAPQPRVLLSPPAGSDQSSIAAATAGSTGYDAQQGGFGATEDPLNLSSILGGILDVAQTYQAVKTIVSPPQVQYAPPVQAPPPVYLAPTAAAAIAQTAQISGIPGLPIQTAALPAILAPLAGGAISTLGSSAMALFSSAGKIAAIAAATGIGIDVIDGILKAGAPKRRRRRMLTKSDTADIATMAALLGKGSESFKTWLAIATRR